MDPNATYQKWLWAVMEKNLDDAKEAARDLMIWLCAGGFEPDWAAGHRPGKQETGDDIKWRFYRWAAAKRVMVIR